MRALGFVERFITVHEELLPGAGRRLELGDPEAGCDPGANLIEGDDGLTDDGLKLRGDGYGGLEGGIRQEDCELVAAYACEQIAWAKSVLEAGGDSDEGGIAGVVAEGVVDQLEAVEVEEDGGDRNAGAVAGKDLLSGCHFDGATVKESGERVG